MTRVRYSAKSNSLPDLPKPTDSRNQHDKDPLIQNDTSYYYLAS